MFRRKSTFSKDSVRTVVKWTRKGMRVKKCVFTPEEQSMLNLMRVNVISKVTFIFISETLMITNGLMAKKGVLPFPNKAFFLISLISYLANSLMSFNMFWSSYVFMTNFREELHCFVRSGKFEGGRRANSNRNMMISMVSKSDAPALLQSETARHNRNLRSKMSVSSSIDELTASMPELQRRSVSYSTTPESVKQLTGRLKRTSSLRKTRNKLPKIRRTSLVAYGQMIQPT